MIITLSKNPISRILCNIENWILDVKTKRWRNGKHVCKCHICGDVLDSTKDKWCPEECGWKRLENKRMYNPWICHSCLEHHNENWKRIDNNSNKKNPLEIKTVEIPTHKRVYKYE